MASAELGMHHRVCQCVPQRQVSGHQRMQRTEQPLSPADCVRQSPQPVHMCLHEEAALLWCACYSGQLTHIHPTTSNACDPAACKQCFIHMSGKRLLLQHGCLADLHKASTAKAVRHWESDAVHPHAGKPQHAFRANEHATGRPRTGYGDAVAAQPREHVAEQVWPDQCADGAKSVAVGAQQRRQRATAHLAQVGAHHVAAVCAPRCWQWMQTTLLWHQSG